MIWGKFLPSPVAYLKAFLN